MQRNRLDRRRQGDWASPWVGVGGGIGGAGTAVIQAGSDSTPGSTPTYIFWWEDAPAGTNYCKQNCPSITAGSTVYVQAEDNGNGTGNFFWENLSTGQYTSTMGSTPYRDDSTLDFVVEYATNTTWNFGTVNFSGATGQVLSSGQQVSAGVHSLNVWEDIISGGACPGAISNQDNFSVTASGNC